MTTTDFTSGTPAPAAATISHATARLKASAAQYAGRIRRARRRANCGDPVEPPAVAGRRQGQGEARQHDEHDDREPPVDEPRRPERRVVHRVARERPQEHVVDHDVQRGQAPDAVQAGQPAVAQDRADPPSRRTYLVAGCESNAVRKRLRKALIGQTGALGLGRSPEFQPQLSDLLQH